MTMNFGDPLPPEMIGTYDTDIMTAAVDEQMQTLNEKIEQAIRDAIMGDFDGVDVHEPGDVAAHSGVKMTWDIEPWHYPAPDADNGRRTTRYEWRWFDQERLKEAVRNDTVMDLLDTPPES